MKNICVFFGGVSCEHDISVITGVMTVNAVDRAQYSIIPVYVDKKGEWFTGEKLNDLSEFTNLNVEKLQKVTFLPGDNTLYLVKKSKLKQYHKIYSAVNCMHGGWGEDGGLYSLLSSCNIPCVSAPPFASALAMDKEFTKIALGGLLVEVLPYVKINRSNYYIRKETALKLVNKKLNFPVIIKPATLGSSIGINIAKDVEELEKGITLALVYDEKVVIESVVENAREINCACYKRGKEIVLSNLEEVVKRADLLSFEDKYKTPVDKICPANIPFEIAEKIKNTTKLVYRKLGFLGVIRIDYLISGEKVYLNEINTVPGSLAYYLFSSDFEGFSQMLTDMIEESADKNNERLLSVKTFDGGVLNFSSIKIHK